MAEDLSTNWGPGWFRLTPDSSGSYVNGTWSSIAPMHDTRLDFESDVLTNGKVLVAGGEYGSGDATSEVYDPVANTWTVVPVPTSLLDPTQASVQFPSELQGFEDCSSVVISNGEVLIAPTEASTYGQTMLFNPNTDSWSAGPTTFNQPLYYQAEAAWVKLADGSILTVDGDSTTSERYIPAMNAWVNDAIVPVELYSQPGIEEGPGLLLPNGNAIFFGGTGHTAIYTPSGTTSPGSWAAGADFPNGQGMPDAPAAMMDNGRILCATSSTPFGSTNIYNSPTSFYVYSYVSNNFVQINGPTGASTFPGPTYPTLMLDLPDGSVLFGHRSTDFYVFQPGGSPLAAGKPTIATVTTNGDGSLHLTGTKFNGLSQGAAYGDDEQMDSNFPLVRFIDANGNVRYGRTRNWSSTGVMTSNTVVSVDCTIPAGASSHDGIQVVANGIASDQYFAPGSLAEIEVLSGATVLANGQTNAVNFGSVSQGKSGPSVTFTVSNPGGRNLDVTNITVPPGFAIIDSLPPSIATGASATFVVQLETATTGTNSGDIVIDSNDPTNNPFTFPIVGVVNPKMITVGGTASYGVVQIGSSAQGSLIISNLGLTTLTVSNIIYPSTAFSGAWSGTIAAGGNMVVPVTFTPALATNYSGTVVVNASTSNGDTTLAVTAFGATANLVLTVLTNGDGIVTGAPKPANKVLAANARVTLRAVPGKNNVFSNWVGTYNTTKNPLTIVMTTNTIVQANFVTNPFLPFVGTYNGLFSADNNIFAITNAGMLKGLTVTSKGTYSGSLLIDGQSRPFTGAFGLDLQATNFIASKGAEGALELILTLTPNDPAPVVTGIVSNSNWQASDLLADRATNTTLSSAYTLLIPPDAYNASSPIGFGYGLIAASSGTDRTPASAKISGTLADGTTFSQSAPVSADGYISLFASLYGGKGLILGRVNLDNASGDIVGWIHPMVASGSFPTAFTNGSIIELSPWTNPPPAIELPKQLTVVDTENDTPVETNTVTLTFAGSSLNFNGGTGSTAVTGSIAAKTGLVKVSIGSGRTKTTGYGVILLNATNGGGYFLTKTNAGALDFSP